MSHRLLGSDQPLVQLYDVALLDLDGVVYVGDRPVEGAPRALAEVRAHGMRLAFVTNNASRTPDAVAGRLSAMGVPAAAGEVTTSAQAAAHHLADVLPAGAAVLVVGGEGLLRAVEERGLHPVTTALDDRTGDAVAAVVQGFDPGLGWSSLAEAAVAIRSGARWVATNLDRTIPSERGALPGNGSLVHVLTYAFGAVPESTGKPDPTMHRESVERSGAARPVVVGDRLDTDIEGAVRAGAPSLLVLSGVTDAAALLGAGSGERPDYVARDVAGLLAPQPGVDFTGPADAPRALGQWQVRIDDGRVRLAGRGPTDSGSGAEAGGAPGDTALDALRLIAPAVWRCRDDGANPAGPWVVADDDAAAGVLGQWGLERLRTANGA